jgi:hypothetical protein
MSVAHPTCGVADPVEGDPLLLAEFDDRPLDLFVPWVCLTDDAGD